MHDTGTYCSTCGALVPPSRLACDTCGTRLAAPVRTPARAVAAGGRPAASWTASAGDTHCPRCGYRGEGLTYFSRGGHMAGLVVATMLTAGAMGVGGLVYYLARRHHVICPRCGEGWGREGERARALVRAAERHPSAPDAAPPVSRESSKRGGSVLLFALAAILLVVGVAEAEVAALLVGLLSAGGGLLLHRAANAERERRRAALLHALQLPVLKLAAGRGGRLTVTEVATQLGWPMRRAEKVLQSMDDGVRVDSEVTDEGVIVYEFRELRLASAPPERRRLNDAGG